MKRSHQQGLLSILIYQNYLHLQCTQFPAAEKQGLAKTQTNQGNRPADSAITAQWCHITVPCRLYCRADKARQTLTPLVLRLFLPSTAAAESPICRTASPGAAGSCCWSPQRRETGLRWFRTWPAPLPAHHRGHVARVSDSVTDLDRASPERPPLLGDSYPFVPFRGNPGAKLGRGLIWLELIEKKERNGHRGISFDSGAHGDNIGAFPGHLN